MRKLKSENSYNVNDEGNNNMRKLDNTTSNQTINSDRSVHKYSTWIYKIIVLILYNLYIAYFEYEATNDIEGYGMIVLSIIVFIMIILNPLITWIVFRKNNYKGLIIFISFVLTLVLVPLVGFFGNPENVKNYNDNIKEEKEIELILNDTNNNIEFYSNDNYKLLIDIDKKCVYEIRNKAFEEGYSYVKRNHKLYTLYLVQKQIDEKTANKYLLFTKKIDNKTTSITMNIKYKDIDDKENVQALFIIDDEYYILDDGEWLLTIFLEENDILQEKLFSIIAKRKSYISREVENDFYADESFDYLIIRRDKRNFDYYQTYKCDFENKSNSERLKEYLEYIGNYKYNDGEYTEYIINNGIVDKIIFYDPWVFEIFPTNLKKSLFLRYTYYWEYNMIMKNFVSSNSGSYNIAD